MAAVTSGGPTDALAPGGALSKALPDYEDRPEQRAMVSKDDPLYGKARAALGK